jgi:F0F1-type ATP synthase delta subunit
MKIDPNLKEDLKQYISQRLSEKKQIVTVLSAAPLGEKEIALLKNHFPFLKDAHLNYETDPAVMAGVIIKFGSKMIDLSLSSELQKLHQLLYETA